MGELSLNVGINFVFADWYEVGRQAGSEIVVVDTPWYSFSH
jgi:hypothetical protein